MAEVLGVRLEGAPALPQPDQNHCDHVEQGQAKDDGREQHRQTGRIALRPVVRAENGDGAQEEAEEVASAIPHEEASGKPIVAEKTHRAAQEHGQQGRSEPLAGPEEGPHQHTRADR